MEGLPIRGLASPRYRPQHARMRYLLPFHAVMCVLMLAACGESVQPQKTDAVQAKPFENNATDAAGVAEGDKQVSPFGKPAH